MDSVLKLRKRRLNRKQEMYESILKSIRVKIAFFNENNIRFFVYKVKNVNGYGYPILSDYEQGRMKNYLSSKLSKEGFSVTDMSTPVSCQILISW